jgi:hypothetical protein
MSVTSQRHKVQVLDIRPEVLAGYDILPPGEVVQNLLAHFGVCLDAHERRQVFLD